MQYKVIFTGKIAEGYILEKAKKDISEIFKLDEAGVENLFSKTPKVVKSNTDHRSALKIQAAMEKVGAICRIVQAEKNETKPLHGKAKGIAEHKTTEENMITCPKCGFHQIKTEACPKCGIIFKKFSNNKNVSTGNTVKEKKAKDYSILNHSFERKKRDWMPAAVLGVILTIFLVVLIRSLFLFLSDSHEQKDVSRTISQKHESVQKKPRPGKIQAPKSESKAAESDNKTGTTVPQISRIPAPAGKNNFPQANDLIAFYPFNGNANDESGNGNHGTVIGASPVKDRFGNENSAYSFDGLNDFIEIGRPLVSGDFTISFWLKSNGRQKNRLAVPISQGNMNYRGFNFTFRKGLYNGFSWGTWSGKKISNSQSGRNIWHRIDFNFSKDIDTDLTWHHLTATHKDNTVAVYWDGKIQGIAHAYPINYGRFNFNIGRSSGNRDYNHRSFNGVIDDIRIYNRALSGEEVLGVYKNNG